MGGAAYWVHLLAWVGVIVQRVCCYSDKHTHSALTYGGVLWGPALLPADGDLSVDWMAELAILYHRCLCIMMGFGRVVHNDVLYILSG